MLGADAWKPMRGTSTTSAHAMLASPPLNTILTCLRAKREAFAPHIIARCGWNEPYLIGDSWQTLVRASRLNHRVQGHFSGCRFDSRRS